MAMNKNHSKVTASNFTDVIYIVDDIDIGDNIAWDLYKRWRKRAPFCYHTDFRPIVQRAATRTGFFIYIIGNACVNPSQRHKLGDKLEVTAYAKQSYQQGNWQIQDVYWDLSEAEYIFNNACGMRVPQDNLKTYFNEL
jgi:hypothetical protein